jgi:hypothetical protein
MAVSGLSREKIVGSVIRVIAEDDSSFLNRKQNARGYFERRLSLSKDVISEFTRAETLRMYEDSVRNLEAFDKTPFGRRRWLQVLGFRIPLAQTKYA